MIKLFTNSKIHSISNKFCVREEKAYFTNMDSMLIIPIKYKNGIYHSGIYEKTGDFIPVKNVAEDDFPEQPILKDMESILPAQFKIIKSSLEKYAGDRENFFYFDKDIAFITEGHILYMLSGKFVTLSINVKLFRILQELKDIHKIEYNADYLKVSGINYTAILRNSCLQKAPNIQQALPKNPKEVIIPFYTLRELLKAIQTISVYYTDGVEAIDFIGDTLVGNGKQITFKSIFSGLRVRFAVDYLKMLSDLPVGDVSIKYTDGLHVFQFTSSNVTVGIMPLRITE